ncbi:N-alpha-acetyl diaminobutyric acid deacetylase DoeB [Maritimibacter sp. 55A14]|uniref:N(2)-acetyl-L-2,4-diaminobutanoate deacetylase DoeB n=1 Tax=Maritimibacter sp. 55A14 TaxID=2174844 RepID=UPI000D60B456|nr:N(2)-acetyl-L-2,4-diaminobutanoate deacetylase DoeB [Maritimibacter sp. 55A14]PWE32594.1 N-alpha-acetyl diaminobutyric acid deacetylase DoeB [Maritimibacter sp. 55A14]
MIANPITPTVPLDRDGVHHGYLRLPHSHNASAWGAIMIPLTVLRNGEGPTALLTGGNHGDEYEGPVALQGLAHTLDPAQITGRVIIVPAFNYPAFRVGARLSPIDGRNLNRAFPGRPDGTVTEKIADYFLHSLVPMADIVMDFHSGGKTLDFVPFATAHVQENKEWQAACVAAMRAFNAPYSMMQFELETVGLYDTEVEAAGKVFVSSELGGGGTSTARSNAIARKGLRNLLIHAGILKGEMEIGPSVMLDMPDEAGFVFADREGLVEPLADLGDMVQAGDPVVQVWPADRTGVAPHVYVAGRSGLLAGRHFPGLVTNGDFLAVVAEVLG